MKIATGSLHRYCLTLLVVLPWYSPVSAQDADKDGEFFVSFAGSAVFPYDPKGQSGTGGEGINLKAGGGFTAAFGYAFKEGFSTEMEWGYQKVGIGNPIGYLSQASRWQARAGRIGGVIFEGFEIPFPSITIESDGEIKTHSLMGNVYYRYPKWRVSPYAGFGLGAFFHDRAFTSTVTVESELGTIGLPIIGLPNIELPTIGFLAEPLRTTVAYEDSRFAYQIMAGLSTRVSPRVEFHFGYRFRSSRGAPIDADQIEAGIRFRF